MMHSRSGAVTWSRRDQLDRRGIARDPLSGGRLGRRQGLPFQPGVGQLVHQRPGQVGVGMRRRGVARRRLGPRTKQPRHQYVELRGLVDRLDRVAPNQYRPFISFGTKTSAGNPLRTTARFGGSVVPCVPVTLQSKASLPS